jgi:UDP-N-acetylglucosamine 2-epimerase (non-hydrolysing)
MDRGGAVWKNSSFGYQGGAMTILMCMGTRPEIIKMAPVVKALAVQGLDPYVMHTGQHEDMAWPLYEFFGFQPHHIIKLARKSPTLAGLSAELLSEIDHVTQQVQPLAMLVHGDTTSAAMGALAAFYRRVPVGHVEAGLRSGSKEEPFPEEMNRQLIGRMATWHFAPTEGAVQSLAREGTTHQVVHVGNTVVDAALWAADRLREMELGNGQKNAARQWFADSGCERLVLVTAHRRENWGEPLQDIIKSVVRLLRDDPQLAIIWPVHLNPLVMDAVTQAHVLAPASVRARWLLTQPLHYPELIDLMRVCNVLLTDSGGIQEEAVALRKPVLILRNVTERPEVLDCGLGQLVGTQTHAIVQMVQQTLQQQNGHVSASFVNPFGDGTAGQKIARYLASVIVKSPVAEATA